MTKEEFERFETKILAELAVLSKMQQEIVGMLGHHKTGHNNGADVSSGYIPALHFMKAVGIKRWKFDRLIAGNKIKTIKKTRKIYVAVGEVERYFLDPNIQ